jgi:hypothetical protein
MTILAKNIATAIVCATLVTSAVASVGVPVLLPLPAAAADESNEVASAAEKWLVIIDSGKYDESWTDASKLFQDRVPQARWSVEAKGARDPFGPVASRSVQGVRFATSLPGVPDGRYAIVQFRSKFAHKPNARETVSMVMQSGAWKTAGYFIK